MLTLREGSPVGRCAPGLAALWDDHDARHLQVVAGLVEEAVHVLVVGQVALPSKLARGGERTLRQAVTAAGGGGAQWRAVARELVTCWLARTHEAVSDFDSTTSADARAVAEAEAAAAGARWPAVLKAVIEWPGQPLGADEDEVHKRLSGSL